MVQDVTLWFRLLVLQVLFVVFELFVHKKSVNVFSVRIFNAGVLGAVCRLVLLSGMCWQNNSFIFFNSDILGGFYFFLRIYLLNFEAGGGLLHVLSVVYLVKSEQLLKLDKDLQVGLRKVDVLGEMYKKKVGPFSQLSPVQQRIYHKKFHFLDLIRLRLRVAYKQLRKQILSGTAKN